GAKSGARRVVIRVDIGGTFTDLVGMAGQGRAPATYKILTTSRDPAEAVIQGVRDLVAGQGLLLRDVKLLCHRPPLATNALIERKGAKTALLTTEGFRDVLQTGTELRYDLYDLLIEFPTPLVPRELRVPIAERTDWSGKIRRPVDRHAVEEAARRLVADGVESIAICFLHSYASGENEEHAGAAARAAAPRGAGGGSGDGGEPLLARVAGDRRVRARVHHGRQLVRAADHVTLSGAARARVRRRRLSRAAPDHDEQWGHDAGRPLARAAGTA